MFVPVDMSHLSQKSLSDRVQRPVAAGPVGQLSVFLYCVRAKAREHQHPAENQPAAQQLPDQSRAPLGITQSHAETIDTNYKAAPGDRRGPPEFLGEIVGNCHCLKLAQVYPTE